jgi:hypothetical protein
VVWFQPNTKLVWPEKPNGWGPLTLMIVPPRAAKLPIKPMVKTRDFFTCLPYKKDFVASG